MATPHNLKSKIHRVGLSCAKEGKVKSLCMGCRAVNNANDIFIGGLYRYTCFWNKDENGDLDKERLSLWERFSGGK